MKINTSKKSGFTLVEIMIVVAIIGLLAAIAIPNFVRARKTAQAKSCVNALRLIDSATQQLLLEDPAATPAGGAGGNLEPYLGRGTAGTWPNCPTTASDTYTVTATATTPAKPTCSNDPNDATQPALNHQLPD